MINILITEDDEKMRNGLVELLTGQGYHVDFAENGKVGIEKIKKNNYSAVLTDLMMPVMGGMEFLLEAKRLKPNIKFIMITAFGSVESAVEAMKAGASDYITKPFKIDEVQSKIKKVLAETEFETTPQILDSDVIKGISNPIRKNAVKLLARSGKMKFTEIKNALKIEDATKLSFHLRVLKSYNIIGQDNEKVYMLTLLGKKLMDSLKSIDGIGN